MYIYNGFSLYEEFGLVELPVRRPGEASWAKVAERVRQIREEREAERRAQEKAERAKRREAAAAARQAAIDRGEDPPAEEAEPEEDEPAEEEADGARETGPDAPEGEEQEMDASEYPIRVEPQNRFNVILTGPPLSGRTTAARALAAKDGRKVLDIDGIVEWALSGPPSLRSEVDKAMALRLHEHITAALEEHERKEAEREKECKSKKEAYEKRECEKFALPVADVSYLIRRRAELPDCNCGVIFDSLTTKYMESKDLAVEAVLTHAHEKFVVVNVALQQLGVEGPGPQVIGLGSLPLAEAAGGEDSADAEALAKLSLSLYIYIYINIFS